jgi:glycosyltransferase involved in cell wall biosynthesis
MTARHRTATLTRAPVVSVMMPVRNGASTVAGAVESIRWQSFADWELLVVDDGSTDATVAIVSAFDDPRIRLLSDGLWLGLGARLNQAVAQARGQYLARMDADDVSYPERLSRQIAFMEANPDVDLVGTRAIVFRGDGEPIGLLPFRERHEDICARPWNNFPLPHPTWLGRAEWFRRYRYRVPEVLRAEDQDLLLRAYRDSLYACLPDVLLGYRQGEYSLAKTLLARRQLALAQMRVLARGGHLSLALLAGLTGIAKAGVDILAAAPGFHGLYFVRMSQPISTDCRERWSEVWTRIRSGSREATPPASADERQQ